MNAQSQQEESKVLDPLVLPSDSKVVQNLQSDQFWQCTTTGGESCLKEESEEFTIWLRTEFQKSLEECQKLQEREPLDEKKPFELKYEARKKLEELLKEPKVEKGESQQAKIAKGIVEYKLGLNFFECEENNDAEMHLMEALKQFNGIDDSFKVRHFNTLMDIYNSIGIVASNRGSAEKGLKYFYMAEQIYKLVKQDCSVDTHHTSFIQDFDAFLQQQLDSMKKASKSLPEVSQFTFFVDGGLDLTKLEKNYTLTLFYMAQVYTKLNKNELAVHYCAQTMQRQLRFKEYEVKDWCVNSINLAQYFVAHGHFAQAEYCLFAAIQILPKELAKKKKLRATLQMHLAKYYLERLVFGVNNYLNQRELISEIVHKRFVEFPELGLKFPVVKDINDLDEAKLLFRLANTQFKKAQEYYVLDGYVSENVAIRQDVSKLYKYLAMLDPDRDRVVAMTERRRETLEPLFQELNAKVYEGYLAEVGAELSDIYSTLFDVKYEQLKERTSHPKKSEIKLMNDFGLKSVEFSRKIISEAQEKEDKFEYAQAILNLSISIARIYSKLYNPDPEMQLKYLQMSLQEYEKIQKYMQEFKKHKGYQSDDDLPSGMKEQYKMSLEMFELLPIKISKINAQLKK